MLPPWLAGPEKSKSVFGSGSHFLNGLQAATVSTHLFWGKGVPFSLIFPSGKRAPMALFDHQRSPNEFTLQRRVRFFRVKNGDPNGIRTRVTAVKGLFGILCINMLHQA